MPGASGLGAARGAMRPSGRPVTLLDRYIFRSVFFTALAAMAVFAFILVAGNVVRDVLARGLLGEMPWTELGRFTLLLVPYVLAYALPMGVLTGVLLTLGRLSADNEITAMRACGLSLGRVARPILILGVLGALTAIPTNFVWMPWAALQKETLLADALRANPLNLITPRSFIYEFRGLVVYVGERQGAELHDIWAWKVDGEKRATSMAYAQTGRVQYDAGRFELILTADNAITEAFADQNPENYTVPPKVAAFGSMEPMHLPMGQLLGRTTVHQKLQWMTYPELLREEAARAKAPAGPGGLAELRRSVLEVKLALADKFNLVLAVFSFAFLGVPLGIKISRRETSANLGLAVALALAFEFLTAAAGWLDRRPDLHPDLLMWIPNLLFLVLGVLFYRRLVRT